MTYPAPTRHSVKHPILNDGSNVMADMAIQTYAGNAARGMSLIALQ